MLDKLRKLVAVAEDIAAEVDESGYSVDGINVHVEGDQGFVRVGHHGIVGVTFSSDDNVHFPEYGIDYYTYLYDWRDGEWVERIPAEYYSGNKPEEVDDLPF